MNQAGEKNRSVRNTKRKLREGLLQLMEKKPVNEISVKELTDLVDINRGTFYFHYQDIYDLLRQIEDDFFEQFDGMLGKERSSPSATGYPYLHMVFSFLGDNRDFCRIMLGPHGDIQFVDRVKKRVDAQCSHFWELLAPGADRERYGMYNTFIINGCVGLIQEWVTADNGNLTVDNITELTATVILTSVAPSIQLG
jgi:AcrR family transcriptional regulator